MALAGLIDLEGYRVALGSVDARGWPVYDLLNDYVGTVEDLIVDTEAMEARYVQVALDGLLRSVVLSLQGLVLDGHQRRVLCPLARKEDLERLPYIGGTELAPDEEKRVAAAFTTGPDEARSVLVIGVEPEEASD